MIYITGDTHGEVDIEKVFQFFEKEKENREVTKEDYLIILGDVAVCWGGNHDLKIQFILHSLPCTVLWIDGNHENHNMIDSLPVTTMFGGKVHVITEDIIHLMRGEVYTIEGKTFFTFGGGLSIDKAYRIPNISWWEREMPSEEEYEQGKLLLELMDNEIDYVLTHTAPRSICEQLVSHMYSGEEELQNYLEDIKNHTKFKKWYYGHWHKDCVIGDFIGMYKKVERLC